MSVPVCSLILILLTIKFGSVVALSGFRKVLKTVFISGILYKTADTMKLRSQAVEELARVEEMVEISLLWIAWGEEKVDGSTFVAYIKIIMSALCLLRFNLIF